MTGTLMALGVAGVLFLALRRLPRDPGIALVALLWVAASAAQAAATTSNFFMTQGAPVSLPRVLLSPMTTGWMLIGLCIAVGGQAAIASAVVVRAICIQAGWILVFSGLSVVLFAVLGLERLEVPSPLALLLPSSLPIVYQQLTMKFFQMDSFMGGRVLRLTLFFPWATTLSLASAAALLIALRERDVFWRRTALAGGLLGTVLSQGRSAMVCVAAALLLFALLRLSPRARFGLVVVVALALNLAVVLGFDPVAVAEDFYRAFTEARSGSSAARYIVYELTWRRVLDAPWLGHGWFSGPAARWLPTMPLGSHSTFYGVLYIGGILTFAVLCLAFATTVLSVAMRLQDRREDAIVALPVLLVIGVVANGETFQNMVPSLLLLFVWLGSALRPAATAPGATFAQPAGGKGGAPLTSGAAARPAG
ncbi:O-antigen ligase family protein [Roseicella aerolata]|uniref:O-antigen ligase family protein n=1 Tax=Roseicella aerolata TaxID=2883479 RepID=A0A9X1IK60_9PROT|nr:O-antigen ligase family protein [Roseicella aerolata]MCB4825123.1 O-antigen ligase family protein [Roseicella aerolata]